jgi:hypothetical protein
MRTSTNAMIASAVPIEAVLKKVSKFIGRAGEYLIIGSCQGSS